MIVAHLQKHRTKYAAGATALTIATAAVTANFEGFEPVAVHERADPPNVITYCMGRTNYDDPNLKIGDRCTREQGEAFLASDLENKYLPPLRVCIPGFDAMPLHRQIAFLDAAYNLGDGTVCKSSMARKINAGDVRGACDAFLAYDRANGKVLRGLQRRREAERALCLRED
jgi:lysozyme